MPKSRDWPKPCWPRKRCRCLRPERDRLVNDVQHELFGLGPLEPLLADPTISDILVNSYRTIYIERRGKLEVTNVAFKDDEHLMRVIERIVSSVGRRIDESSPMVDARLQDGSRVNAIIPPLSIDGPVLSIRRFGAEPLRMNMLIEKQGAYQRHCGHAPDVRYTRGSTF